MIGGDLFHYFEHRGFVIHLIVRMMMRCIFVLCFLTLAVGVTVTGGGQPKVENVFISGNDGYHSYRIPALVVATNRTVLAFCEGRKGGVRDNGRIDIALKRSADGGNNWSAQQIVWSDKENTCGNPAPVVDRTTGVVWLLMTWNLGLDQENQIVKGTSKNTRRVFVSHSADNGERWAKPVEITSSVKKQNWGWYATGPVNGIQLTRGTHKGRLVVPANHTETDANGEAITRSHVIFSDNQGETWQIGGIEEEKTNESTVVELNDGSLLHNMRSYHNKNRRAVARSRDGGLSWSAVRLDEALIEPVCQASILRLSWAKNGERSRILFSNPAGVKRERLTVRVSYDEGVSWPVGKVIHDRPAAYSCLAALPDGTIGWLFENGSKNPYERISLARLPVAWMEGK
jgi:sialidase-1